VDVWPIATCIREFDKCTIPINLGIVQIMFGTADGRVRHPAAGYSETAPRQDLLRLLNRRFLKTAGRMPANAKLATIPANSIRGGWNGSMLVRE
jgi:hypothetical protein